MTLVCRSHAERGKACPDTAAGSAATGSARKQHEAVRR